MVGPIEEAVARPRKMAAETAKGRLSKAAKIAFELVSPDGCCCRLRPTWSPCPDSEGYMGVMAAMPPGLHPAAGMIDVLVDGKDDRYFIRGGFAEIGPRTR